MLNKAPVSPSAVPFRKELQAMFATPRALEVSEIEEIIQRFASSAAIAEKAGFSGVQIHGAHGYLVRSLMDVLAVMTSRGVRTRLRAGE